MKKTISIFLLLLTMIFAVPAFPASATAQMPARDAVNVEKIEFNNPGFLRGMDVSSVLSLESSGVTFKNYSGQTEDLFKILADNGVNCIRVRVWNNPFDSNGNGYGGGNNDVTSAAQIGRRAAKYGMKLLVDFHYSDFWADPGKQKAPKQWEGLPLAQKQERVKSFTLDSLRTIRDAGAEICMVQIGNETNNGVAGEYGMDSMAKIYNAGAQAVREFDSKTLVALHYTNPEYGSYLKSIVDSLSAHNVDYDVFAVSYYPYWHGSLENLSDVLGYAAKKYGKCVMVAETSYANTLADTDGHPNTVSQGSNSSGENLLWDFSVQGQADELRSVMAAVNSVDNARGIGVFYWEGAWITVGDLTGLSGSAYSSALEQNKLLWKRFGSGWASEYSAEYDPDDAGKWYGGSAVDNQAFFDSSGSALPSLTVFKNVLTGSVSDKVLLGDVNGDGEVTVRDATEVQRFAADITKLDARSLIAADTDQSGDIMVSDATEIQRYIADYAIAYPINRYI